MEESEDTEKVSEPQADAVDILEDFVQCHCEIAIGREFQTPKTEFQTAFGLFCKKYAVESPSNGLLETLLVKLFSAVWSDIVELNGGKTPVWRNLVLKEMLATKNKGVR